MARIRVGGNVHIERVVDMDLARPGKRAACDPGRADRIRELTDQIRSNPAWRCIPAPGDGPTKRQAPRLRTSSPTRVILTDQERVDIARWLQCYLTCSPDKRKELLVAIGVRYRGVSYAVVRKIMRRALEMRGVENGRGK